MATAWTWSKAKKSFGYIDGNNYQLNGFATITVTELLGAAASGYIRLQATIKIEDYWQWGNGYNPPALTHSDWIKVGSTTYTFSGSPRTTGNGTYTCTVDVPESVRGQSASWRFVHFYSTQSGNSNMTLNVHPRYTISYNANGHGTAPSSQTKYYGDTATLSSGIANVTGSTNTVTITGNANGGTWSGSNGSATWITTYSQSNWNTASGGGGTSYNKGASYATNANLSLYAIWSSSNAGTGYTLPTGTPTKAATTQNTRTVTINANGGTCSITTLTSSQTVTYTFKGWFTAATGGTQRTTSSRVTAAETVYAQYDSTEGGQTAVTLPTALECTKSGAVLAGFSTSSTAETPTYQAGSAFTPSANIILYAVWSDVSSSTYNGRPRGFVGVYKNNDYHKYIPKVRVGSVWKDAIPYVYFDGHWVPAGGTGELMVEFLTSQSENFITNNEKFMVRKQ